MKRTLSVTVVVICTLGSCLLGARASFAVGGSERAASHVVLSGDTVKVATWNIMWLHAESGKRYQVRRNVFATREDEDYDRLRRYAERLDADVIALQEVDGGEAAERIFDPDEYDFYFEPGDRVQRVGFAVREGLSVVDDPDFLDLITGRGLRAGAVITVEIGGEPVRFMNVHLKSFCHEGALPEPDPEGSACAKLAAQVEQLEFWIDRQAAGDTAFVILGDFNRRFNMPGDELWAEIDDGDPAHADLEKATEGQSPICWGSRKEEYIDHIVLDARSARWVVEGSFEETAYAAADAEHEFVLSDHCPLSVLLSPGGMERDAAVLTLSPSQRAAVLSRIESLERELQELRIMLEQN